MVLHILSIQVQVEPNSPPDEEGTPERSEGGEVIQRKHFVIRRIVDVLTSPAALRGGRPLLVKRGISGTKQIPLGFSSSPLQATEPFRPEPARTGAPVSARPELVLPPRRPH